ncbi:tripartite tricarboxylate transporter substrate binding protein [Limnohabitans sp. INBF002]|uniref:Bug family tripartite tricarboxylate transporter substrate binding protein n=1 Tax=Limnohabitans sp. INBF002 TaxID=2986280 RepID=UPI0023773C36|nr:tripartite tricarboxylate transporter substrate binding protein [Limnohabitans sp. INBF002]BDU52335.1 ABC transporter substrate-binding protein [Limnohabitans sp. INBF002]
MFHFRRKFLLSALSIATSMVASTGAFAQEFPNKTITIVVPFSAGGGVDTIARLLAEKLRGTLKQNVIVDNKAGGSGMIGANAVVKATPDGYTLLLGSAGETAINAFVYKNKMQYNPAKDLAPITLVTRIPNVLVASPTLPVKNIEELVAYGKKNPGKLAYSTSGVGNPQHLNGELLEELAGIHMVHIPYKGASGQLVDVVSGNVDMTFVSYTAAKAFIKDGKVKVIAVTSAKRTSFAPEIPAIAEYKPLAKYQLENWFGLFAPAGTPDAVLQKLNAAVTQAIKDPDLAKRLQDQGGEPAPMSTQQFRDFIKTESVQFQRIVETANITAE